MHADAYDQLVFVDTETTGLDPTRHTIWEVAILADGNEFFWILPVSSQALISADPRALAVGGYSKRALAGAYDLQESEIKTIRQNVARQVSKLTAGRHLVGANPAFDAAFLTGLLQEADLQPEWHYHLLDIEPLMLGVLAERGVEVPIPWKSTELSEMLGVPGPTAEDRHTALGDARWCRRVVESVFHLGVDVSF